MSEPKTTEPQDQNSETSLIEAKQHDEQAQNKKEEENVTNVPKIILKENEIALKEEEKPKEGISEAKTEPSTISDETICQVNPTKKTEGAEQPKQKKEADYLENDAEISPVDIARNSDPETKAKAKTLFSKKIKHGTPLHFPATQNFDDDDDSFYAESQPNVDLFSLVHRPKPKPKSVHTLKLPDIPTWTEKAHEIIQENKDSLSTIGEPLFPPNKEINDLISYLPRGDSTALEIDAIVNAANSGLYAGGGICGAIHHAAGRELEDACMKFGGCKTGGAVVTPGFNLPARYVIHAVGPVGEHPQELVSAYKATLDLMDGVNIRSVGLCCLSTGIYGYPIRPATKIALRVVREFLEDPSNRAKVDRIIFVVFLPKDCRVYENYLPLFFPIGGNGSENINENENQNEKGLDDEEKEKREEEKIVSNETFKLENNDGNEINAEGKVIERPKKNEEDQLSLNEESEYLEKTDDNLEEKTNEINYNQDAQNPDN